MSSHTHTFHRVVDFDPDKEKLLHFDFTDANKEIGNIDFADTESFTSISKKNLKKQKQNLGLEVLTKTGYFINIAICSPLPGI